MKVRFTGVEGHEQSVRQGADVLRQGQVYVILEAYCQVDGPNYFRIEYRRGELPPLFDSRLFELVDPRMHSSWTVSTEWDGSLTMAPAVWQVPGFWEEFIDHFPRAIEVYELGKNALMAGSE
ncbi:MULTISPECIES: hypothetical protein [Streptomyces]|uniref:hypothetical protein n=1 Tax=Streptomyces TaxID=1883 RepID=UPI002248F90A|nr:hypothetical protein [Streptomyces sp. JHD 1]MCX2968321.1 hypothetical protein [Streptomyces sp. JHD 1]